MKYKKISLALLLFSPLLTLADLMPNCSGPDCNFCNLMQLGENIKNFLILNLGAPAAALMFAYAGFLYMSGNPGNIGKAKGIFINVLYGFVIMLSAYLVVDVVLTSLANDDVKNAWKDDIKCEPTAAAPVVTGNSGGVTGSATGTGTTGGLTYADAYSQLTDAGIGVHSTDNCSDPNIETCTALVGIKQSTIEEALRLKQECEAYTTQSCNVIVTGGTETGHSTTGDTNHSTGYKIDIDKGQTGYLDTYLETVVFEGDNVVPGTISGYPSYTIEYDTKTIVYLNEGNHWDMKVVPKEVIS